jgi:hypothetical protein
VRHRWLVTALVAELAIALAAACGARTGLPVEETQGQGGEGGNPVGDAGVDRDGAVDAAPDRVEDVPDVFQEGLPACDPEALYIYLVTTETFLYRFDPANNAMTLKGAISCPASVGATPFSMGVDRTGRAFVLYNDGEVVALDVETTVCTDIGYEPNQEGFDLFGMGFAIDDDGMGETLYVAEITFGGESLGLGTIDTQTLDLDFVAPFSETFGSAMELTSADDGRLYGYNLDEGGAGGWVIQIDKETAQILEATFVPVGNSGSLAFAQWGGDFYIFTSPNGVGTTVTRFDPDDGSVQDVATLNETVVGAGVSTCKTGGP